MSSAAALAQAVPRVWEELPAICGEAWLGLQWELWGLLGDLEAGREDAVDAILALLSEFPLAMAALERDMARGPAPEKSVVAGSIHMERRAVLPVFFGTDRVPKGRGFGSDATDGVLHLGVVEVSVPDRHEKGQLEGPPWWKLGFGWDPDEHVKFLSLAPLERADFVARARRTLRQGHHLEALIYIHGYNVDFEDAARRAAQVVHDLRFPGLAMLYSWPSKGSPGKASYLKDGDKVSQTRARLQEFLRLVMTEMGLVSVHLVAHSMGNRALTEVLSELEPAGLPASAASLQQVVFAAPDVNAQTFADLAKKFAHRSRRCTLYASSKDLPLKVSRKWNDSARAGDAGARLLVIDGIDTVDATHVDTSLLGHSYYGSNRTILTDIQEMILYGRPPDQRGDLDPMGTPDARYWAFPR